MQNAETVLGVLRERGRKGLPLDELYRQLFNPQLYLLAYGRIYSNDGAMTPGVTQETVDGMSWGKIGRIIDAVRHERYRFSPARRVWIPKKNGKLRPLGLPTWPDKLLGEVVRLLLEAYYEPQFSGRSHGFRPGLGCHTALGEVARTWTGTTWFIEGDVADCFGSLDHEIMIKILAEKIRDNRFLRLMRNMLRAGYLEDWRWNATLSGAPQGGVVSPILSNVYLHKLDDFAGNTLIPEYTRGESRARNKEYESVRQAHARARKKGDHQKARKLRRKQASLPSVDCDDPGYRRLHYLRYADDTLFGFTGPKAEAEEIKQRLTTASCASTAARCRCTTSPGWLTSHTPAPASQHGPGSWRNGGASPSWSARPATTRSMPNGHQPQSQPRHKSPESRMPGNLVRPVRRGAVRKRTRELRAPRRAAYPTDSARRAP